MKELPLVSILCSVYNGERFVAACVNSCLSQTYRNVEICLVDDGSTDNTWGVLNQGYQGVNKVKLFKFDSNKGKVAGFNRAYFLSRGKYIGLIGADDIMMPCWLETAVKVFQKESVDLIYGKGELCDKNFRPIDHVLNKRTIKQCQDISFEKILSGNLISGGTMLFTRSFAEQIFPIPEDLKYEDWWISFHALKNYKVKFVNELVAKGIYHGGNTTALSGSVEEMKKKRRYFYDRDLIYYNYFCKFLQESEWKLKKIITLNIIIRQAYLENNFFRRLKWIPLIIKNLYPSRLFIKAIEAVLLGEFRHARRCSRKRRCYV